MHRARTRNRHRAQGLVTELHTFYRDRHAYQRVTIRFTDQQGNQRWLTRTAPPGARSVTEHQNLGVHYDPADPGHRRGIVIDWPMY